MNYTIENEKLRVVISSAGAEVQSVYDKVNERELWWDGDPQYWDGRSPILFPACGGLWNGEYTHEGKTYKMPKHGFVRKMEWEMKAQQPTQLVFSVAATEETLEVFPFHFNLVVVYQLTDNALECYYAVENHEDSRIMPYQIGGHPAIALPDFKKGGVIGYIQPQGRFHGTPSADCLSVVRAGEQGCWSRERHAVPTTDEGLIPICVETFANEALIFDHQQIDAVNILTADKERIATVTSDAPVWLFWQQQNQLCPYICAEPWYGLCDLQGESVGLIERPYTQCALPMDATQGILWRAEF